MANVKQLHKGIIIYILKSSISIKNYIYIYINLTPLTTVQTEKASNLLA
jgi:hypothetical protein